MMLEDAPTPEDKVLHASGIKVYVDGQSVALLQGSEIDYVDTLMGAGFTVNNPNAVSASRGSVRAEVAGDPNVFPTAEMLARTFTVSALAPAAERARGRVWTRFKAGR